MAQIKEALTILIVSAFSKKFIAFVAIAYVLYREKRWTELLIAFGSYAGIEVADKKIETVPQPPTTVEPIPPEATPEPTPDPNIVIVSPDDADTPE